MEEDGIDSKNRSKLERCNGCLLWMEYIYKKGLVKASVKVELNELK
jgi:hypothetical protein